MSLLQMSFSGAVLILAVAAIRAAAIHLLPKKTFLILWGIVLFRLIVPFSIPSTLNVYSFVNRHVPMNAFDETLMVHAAFAMQKVSFGRGGEIQYFPVNHVLSVSMWSVIWMTGMILCTAFFIISYLRCRFEFQASLPVQNEFVIQWLKAHPLRRPISIRQSDKISSPLTYGILTPVILMPKKTDWENTAQLQYVLLHEYIHICRYDAALKLSAALALCLHWFNPLVWVMYFLFNRDIELACDESVIRQLGEKSIYASILINMEADKSGLMPFSNGFRKNAAEERITAIMKTKQTTVATIMLAGLVVFISVGMSAVSAAAIASPASREDSIPSVNGLQTDKKERIIDTADTIMDTAIDTITDNIYDSENSMSIIHESADILSYENGWPYLHDILTNHTDKAITETEYCMLAYNENGMPLKLYWNFLDRSQESSYDYLVRTAELNIPPGQTEHYHGGWSLYDRAVMDGWPVVGNGEANQVAYSLFCLKQVVFEDGSIWNNPNYENWFETYAGKEVKVEDLQNYYPYQYEIASNTR